MAESRTIQEMWRIDPTLQGVISTAFSDNPWEDSEAAAKETGLGQEILRRRRRYYRKI